MANNELKNHTYEFDEVVVGLTTSSLLYSYIFNVPVIFKLRDTPKFFEFVDNSVNLTKTGLLKEDKQLNFPKGKYVKSYSKERVLNHLFMIQSLCGNIPFNDGVIDLRLDEENKILKITTKNERIIKYKFNKLRIFDTRGLSFLKPTGTEKEKQYILDEFKVNIKGKKFYHVLNLQEDFPRNIYYSPEHKTMFAQSYLTNSELCIPDFSSFFITKITERELKSFGINANLEWVKRHFDLEDHLEYETNDWLIIDKRNEEEIWKDRKISTLHTWLGSFRSRMVQRMMDTLGQNA